ncbi:Bax inhibitor-1 family protein, partial [Escherichia coli]|uniref:Bax inhibitor-1 family protein n=1 Tax=Escherichia coli TaxID=562 RepID=UPI0014855F9B
FFFFFFCFFFFLVGECFLFMVVFLFYLICGVWVCVIGLYAISEMWGAGLTSLFFIVYLGLTGIPLSSIFIVYTAASIASTFVVTAGMFGAMSLYGYTTKR